MDTNSEFRLRLVRGEEPVPVYNDLPEDPAQRALLSGVLMALMTSLDAKDSYTKGHSERVALLASQVAREMGFDEHEVELVRMAGMVHDLGKIGVPESVLRKAGRLTDVEYEQVKLHPDVGRKIVAEIPLLFRITPAVLHHHERWDGRGYPSALKGESIPQYARILAVADSYDAMRSKRCYSTSMGRDEVIAEISKCDGIQFDPQVVAAFLRIDLSKYEDLLIRHHAQEAA
jgi:HD-GYP domain-containing protein (c-di-GMP phosphodiesterase class II)